MMVLVIVALVLLVVVSVVVINYRNPTGGQRGDLGVGLGLHRARRTLDTTLLKQDIRRDARRFRRELRQELDDIEGS